MGGMDDRVKRLIDLKETVKGYFEVTGVGVGGWEAGFDAVRHTDVLAESFVLDLRRLVSFIEAEFEFADETNPDQPLPPARPAGPRPPTTSLSRPAPPAATRPAAPGSPARAAIPAAAPARPAAPAAALARPAAPAATAPGRPGALASAAAAARAAAAVTAATKPAAPAAAAARPAEPPMKRPASGSHPAASRPAPITVEDKVPPHGVDEYPVDPTERVVLPEKRSFSPSGRHRRK